MFCVRTFQLVVITVLADLTVVVVLSCRRTVFRIAAPTTSVLNLPLPSHFRPALKCLLCWGGLKELEVSPVPLKPGRTGIVTPQARHKRLYLSNELRGGMGATLFLPSLLELFTDRDCD